MVIISMQAFTSSLLTTIQYKKLLHLSAPYYTHVLVRTHTHLVSVT